MSTPNPTHIIAEHLHADTFTARNRVTKERAVVTRCLCGDTVPAEDFAAHVVSELTDAGYSIVPSEWLTKPQDSRVGEKVTVSLRGGEPFNGTIIEENPGGQRGQRFLVEDEDGFKLWANHSVITSAAAEGEKP